MDASVRMTRIYTLRGPFDMEENEILTKIEFDTEIFYESKGLEKDLLWKYIPKDESLKLDKFNARWLSGKFKFKEQKEVETTIGVKLESIIDKEMVIHLEDSMSRRNREAI